MSYVAVYDRTIYYNPTNKYSIISIYFTIFLIAMMDIINFYIT